MASYEFNPQDDHIKLSFDGEITLENSFSFKDEIKEKIEKEQCNKMIVDLTNVSFMDSSGLGMLISFFKEINEKHGTIVYYGVHDYVEKLLSLVKLDQVFVIRHSEQDAIEALH